ncbi:MAG TPA: gliding motility-associated C-terminal domain-containing protein [Bacteroidia bacterium]|jgi:gliding motility-associated-like protein|nr:gliding motility-associated C-terminal domain-containing protein [Bacteroidia bacterium]
MKHLFCLIFCQLLLLQAFGSHIIGGDITVRSIGGNRFEITLHFFRDCNSSTDFDIPLPLGIFDKQTNALVLTDSMNLSSKTKLVLGDSCFRPANMCIQQGLFIDTITLPNNPHGYYLSWERCCRNSVIQNLVAPGNTGMVFYAEIPDPALFDSTPVFGSYPKAYMCANQPNSLDFSATDTDGDSLVYSLVRPYRGHTTSGAPVSTSPLPAPYDTVTFNWPSYGMFNIVGGNPSMAINPHTGIITASPNVLGIFVWCVEVDEYRHGIKIGEIRRDIQFEVLNCNNNLSPVFTSPANHSYFITAGDSLCLQIIASDADGDWVSLHGTSSLPLQDGVIRSDSAQGIVHSSVCIQTSCSDISNTPYQIHLMARDYSCYPGNTTVFDMSITVKAPEDGKVDSLVPNVFTPNGDGIHDAFQIRSRHLSSCYDNFHIQIFDRWGILMYESHDFLFSWDGHTKTGTEAGTGVYYYVMEAGFMNSTTSFHGFVQLIR